MKTHDKCPKCAAKPSWWDQSEESYNNATKYFLCGSYEMRSDGEIKGFYQSDECKIRSLETQ